MDTALMDSNRNQPRKTHHQGSQQLADLFFFVFFTGSGLSQEMGGMRGKAEKRMTHEMFWLNETSDISTLYR